jgi:hypothetical protein
MQIFSVPLSGAFVQAHDADLFAQNISMVPNGVAALNAAVASFAVGAPLDGVITVDYTNSSVFGTQVNSCDIGLTDTANNTILQAEQNADGLPTQQRSCTFYTVGLNSGSLAKPAVPFSAFGGTSSSSSYISVTNVVLGNGVTTSQHAY